MILPDCKNKEQNVKIVSENAVSLYCLRNA